MRTTLLFAVMLFGLPAGTSLGALPWAIRPLARPAVPSSQCANPIDAFVGRAQSKSGLSPAPEADRFSLIRRLSFDLRGLPPTPDEVDAFVHDQSPLAYERLVDRYLASADFGERFATPWLDLVRYADSDGFELDGKRRNAWRYRDWVIDALNADMPFDRFVRLQIAADEIAADVPKNRAALGFLRNGPSVANERTEAVRMDELDDIVRATTGAFLGLTVGCARCHDHKNDAIPTDDYYRLVAVFATSRPADLPLVSESELAGIRARSSELEALVDTAQVERIAIEKLRRDGQLDQSMGTAIEQSSLAECQARINLFTALIPPSPPEARGVSESETPVTTYVLERGDVGRKLHPVRAGPPRLLSGGKVIEFADVQHGSRSALATWITGDAKHLVARVQVNRIWQSHFGQGIVPTPSDFGTTGEAPSLPDLLEWLAAEFIDRGWSQKAIHRLIVTSATYRQSSRSNAEGVRVDPTNRLLWRYPAHRLEAEMIRDAIFACAGSLNRERGGPAVFPPIDPSLIRTGNLPRWPLDARDGPEVWRRSVYVFRMRSIPLPFLELFDAPDRALPCPTRTTTIAPSQCLTLWNNRDIRTHANLFAQRVTREAGADLNARIELAFRIATGRLPTEKQAQASLSYLKNGNDLAGLCAILWNSNAFLFLD